MVLKRKKIAQEMVKNPESSEMMDKMEAVQHKVTYFSIYESAIEAYQQLFLIITNF